MMATMGVFRTTFLVLAVATLVRAEAITLVDTIPSGDLFLQPPPVTGAGDAFGGSDAGNVLADGFTVPISANLDQISVAVEYEDLPDEMGTSPMLLTLLTDSLGSPDTPIESWTVPLSPSDTSLTRVTVTSVTTALLVAGDQYWLSVVPEDAVGTAIGWGLASAGYPGIQLPIAESTTGANGGWEATEPNLANEFSVSGTTPEPATFGISALALVLMIALLFKSRNSPGRNSMLNRTKTWHKRISW